jgi:hypothetical protein
VQVQDMFIASHGSRVRCWHPRARCDLEGRLVSHLTLAKRSVKPNVRVPTGLLRALGGALGRHRCPHGRAALVCLVRPTGTTTAVSFDEGQMGGR